jgi:hypothetical protein
MMKPVTLAGPVHKHDGIIPTPHPELRYLPGKTTGHSYHDALARCSNAGMGAPTEECHL